MVIAVVVEAVGLVGYRRAYGAVGRLWVGYGQVWVSCGQLVCP